MEFNNIKTPEKDELLYLLNAEILKMFKLLYALNFNDKDKSLLYDAIKSSL